VQKILEAKKFFADFLASLSSADYGTYHHSLAEKVTEALPDDLMVIIDDPSFDTPEIGDEKG
jgi:hypothetical protein